jgi:hypothetical protein
MKLPSHSSHNACQDSCPRAGRTAPWPASLLLTPDLAIFSLVALLFTLVSHASHPARTPARGGQTTPWQASRPLTPAGCPRRARSWTCTTGELTVGWRLVVDVWQLGCRLVAATPPGLLGATHSGRRCGAAMCPKPGPRLGGTALLDGVTALPRARRRCVVCAQGAGAAPRPWRRRQRRGGAGRGWGPGAELLAGPALEPAGARRVGVRFVILSYILSEWCAGPALLCPCSGACAVCVEGGVRYPASCWNPAPPGPWIRGPCSGGSCGWLRGCMGAHVGAPCCRQGAGACPSQPHPTHMRVFPCASPPPLFPQVRSLAAVCRSIAGRLQEAIGPGISPLMRVRGEQGSH